ncbi:MAG: hypothetical protein LBR70_04395 [Lactobacillaceae bacterium]|jgi:hypothetical protein|nr:hypothetical protein [Lactobacillaceae bacterium]
MKYQNFFRKLGFWLGNRGSENNLFRASALTKGDYGAIKHVNRVEFVEADELLDILTMRRNVREGNYDEEYIKNFGKAYESATRKFLISPDGIAKIDARDQLKIALALGLHEIVALYDDKYFNANENESGVDHIEGLFDYATQEEREALLHGFMMYFSKSGRKVHWTVEHEDLFMFITDKLVENVHGYDAFISPELAQYLIDAFGLDISFNKANNHAFIDTMDYASAEGLAKFFVQAQKRLNEKEKLRLPIIENLLYLRNKETLLNMVGAIGCYNPNIEGFLIYEGILPEGSISKQLCHPVNFTMLLEKYGAEKVAELYPEGYKQQMPQLLEWIQGYESGELHIAGRYRSPLQMRYVLSDDKLCRAFMANDALSADDIEYLTALRKFSIISEAKAKAATKK